MKTKDLQYAIGGAFGTAVATISTENFYADGCTEDRVQGVRYEKPTY
jgi:hypothetical protein